jgi:hypothetical protein
MTGINLLAGLSHEEYTEKYLFRPNNERKERLTSI